MRAEATITALLVGVGTLLFEIALTRVFSLSQGYHFAFLAVSLALLGNAAGGAAVAAGLGFLRQPTWRRPSAWCGGAGLAMLMVLAAVAVLPVDTYALAWSRRQIALFVVYVAVLAVPFVLAGVSLALCFEQRAEAGSVYAGNLVGSAAGALLAALLLPHLGPVRCMALAASVAFAAVLGLARPEARPLLVLVLLGAALAPWEGLLPPRLSPYKPLWQSLHAQGAQLVASYWSRYGRIDVVAGPNLRMAGGADLECPHTVPLQRHVFVDGDSPSPILEASSPDEVRFVQCLPAWPALRLRPAPRALVLEPTGDVPLWLALAALPGEVTAMVPNDGVRAALENGGWGSGAVSSGHIAIVGGNPRSALRQGPKWDLIYLPLRGGYRPVGWGAASLAEDYGLTADALFDGLASLNPGGYLVAESWLQQPPSEELRLWLTLIAALRRHGVIDVSSHLMAARSMQTAVMIASPTPWSAAELAWFRREADALGLDLVWLPGLRAEEANRHNLLPEDLYYRTFAQALGPDTDWIAAYPFALEPATDSRPFPHDYFKWSQTGRTLSQVGRVALPMGGLGFLILPLTLLVLAPLSAALLAPALVRARARPPAAVSAGFLALGLGYMAVELPLMQQVLLVVRDVPSTMALVLSAMLLGSGFASALSDRYRSRLWAVQPALWAVAALLCPRWLLPSLLTAPGWLRAMAVFALGAGIGFGLGGAFPTLMRLSLREPGQRAWAVAVNGTASVLASVLATATSVLGGFELTLAVAIAAYAGVALLTVSGEW